MWYLLDPVWMISFRKLTDYHKIEYCQKKCSTIFTKPGVHSFCETNASFHQNQGSTRSEGGYMQGDFKVWIVSKHS